MIGIINYGSGNVFAIANLLKRINVEYFVSDNYKELELATKLVLPGVGAFDHTMAKLQTLGLKNFLNDQVLLLKKPILGVCVGMQILGESSEEGSLDGFGWIKGNVKKINISNLIQKPFLPHLGWNSIIKNRNVNLLEEIDLLEGFYFLHSYYFECFNSNEILASVNYGGQFPCIINKENIYGVQFHPEKSHLNGMNLFKNFSKI